MQALQLINQQVGRFAREKVIAFRAENFIFRKSIFNSKISLYFFEMKTCKSEQNMFSSVWCQIIVK